MLLDDNNNVITYLNKLEVKHREIKYGIKYILPPSKGVDIFSINLNLINSIPNSDIEIALGEKVGSRAVSIAFAETAVLEELRKFINTAGFKIKC